LARARAGAAALGNGGAAAARRPPLRGDGPLTHRASEEPVLPDGAYERALLQRRRHVVVRRRHGSHAVLRLRRRCAALPCPLPRRAHAFRRRLLPALYALVRRVFPYPAPRRTARHWRRLLRRSRGPRLRLFLCALALGDGAFSGGVPADPRAPPRPSLRRARALVPG